MRGYERRESRYGGIEGKVRDKTLESCLEFFSELKLYSLSILFSLLPWQGSISQTSFYLVPRGFYIEHYQSSAQYQGSEWWHFSRPLRDSVNEYKDLCP